MFEAGPDCGSKAAEPNPSRDIFSTRLRNRVEDFTALWRKGGYSLKRTPPGRGAHPGKPNNMP